MGDANRLLLTAQTPSKVAVSKARVRVVTKNKEEETMKERKPSLCEQEREIAILRANEIKTKIACTDADLAEMDKISAEITRLCARAVELKELAEANMAWLKTNAPEEFVLMVRRLKKKSA